MSYYNNNKEQIITKTKKIVITKKIDNTNTSPKRVFNTNQIYNRRMVSPQKIKFIQNSPNKLYHIYQTEEIKENNNKNNDNNSYLNKNNNNKRNDDYNMIYNKEDFNNNKYYQNSSQDEYDDKENSCIKTEKTFTYDIIKNKNRHLVRYNYNYISPKKNSKVLLKNVICSPVMVSYTEIKDAELKSGKEYQKISEEIEETEINIKNKMMNIWENVNKKTEENSFVLLGEENLEKKYMIESYEKKIKELNETILNLIKEKEQNKKNEFLDNIIQSFNFKIIPKKTKSIIPLSKVNEHIIYIQPKPKFKNTKQNINSFNINKISKPKNKKQKTAEFCIKSNCIPINNKIEKINDIYIPKQKIKFTSDSIYGQELCILSKKKKKIYIMENTESISILKEEKIPPPLEAYFIDEICLPLDEEFLLKRFQQNNKYNKINDIFIPGLIKPENSIEQNVQLIIEPTRNIQELYIEYQDSITLYEISKNIYEIHEDDKFIIEGEDLPLYEIEKVNEFYNYTDMKFKNDDLDIEQLEYVALIKEKLFTKNEIEKIEEFEIIPEQNEENFEYNMYKYKKSKYIYELENQDITIEDTANFQIIAMSIRELYQQKLQGFSIFKKEKKPNEIQNEIFFSILTEKNSYINENEKLKFDKSNNNKINKSKKIIKNNKVYYDYNYNNSNVKTINTVISKNNKTFIAYPKKEIEYINTKEIFNENSHKYTNNDLFHSEDESIEKKNYFMKTYTNNNNEINKRYKSKILLRKSNNDSNNSYIPRKNILSFNTKDKINIQTTPKKIQKYQYNSEYKSFTGNKLNKRKIYRFEEGKEVEIIKK